MTPKQFRDQCINAWCLDSHKVPSWLMKHRAALITQSQATPVHGLSSRWLEPIALLRKSLEKDVSLPADLQAVIARTVPFESKQTLAQVDLRQHLKNLMPWRKGPWRINDISIQSEWDSSKKYTRLQDFGPSVTGKNILDIGCGNGYYGYRMLGDGADYVLGMDPAPLFWAQFQTFKSFSPTAGIDVLPLTGDPLTSMQLQFDLALSMGVLYHRRNPLDHLRMLRSCLKPEGELLMETLVVDDQRNTFIMPSNGTYAGMSNVWGLPSVALLQQWLKVCGFRDVECVSLSLTQSSEQTQTPWIATQTLEDFMSPDRRTTREGLPPPWRAMIKAIR